MREIKFRAWDRNHGKMVFPNEQCTTGTLIDWFEDEDLMQFTGLKDRNGKEVYEGDIVTCEATQREINNVIEKYEKNVVSYEDGYFYPFGYNCGWRSSVDDIEVIGNIHENPELMQK